MPQPLFDSHAHLTSDKVIGEVEVVLQRAKKAGVEWIVNICTDLITLEHGLKLSEKHSHVYNSGATTPHDVETEGEAYFPIFAEKARSGSLVAIGETGLDYFYKHSPKEIQQDFLRRYLQLALECQLPVIIHCREAFQDFFEILDQEYKINGRHAPGVLHCFTGTIQEAHQVLERGWYLSLSGIVTFKKSAELKEIAKMTPLDQLLIETDTPYLAPQSQRGKQNEPAFVKETAEMIAFLKGLSLDEVAKATALNAKRLFGIKSDLV